MSNNLKNKERKFTGGLRFGLISTTWPNGELYITEDKITLKDKGLNREVVFSRDDITDIQVKKVIPLIGHGVRIHHSRKDVSKKVIFWYSHSKMNQLIEEIQLAGWNVSKK